VAGRTVNEAIANYKDDLQSAFRCLDCFSRIEFAAPNHREGERCSWFLGGPGPEIGIELPGIGGRLEAAQTLTIIKREGQPADKRFGLTTNLYNYSMTEPNGREIWAMHWHPEAPGSVAYPHIHLPRWLDGRPHLATSRLLVEHALHWTIEAGATPRYPDWYNQLKKTIVKHEKERNWS